MESNHAQLVEDLGLMKQRQAEFEAAMSQYLTTITRNIAALVESQARADARQDRIEEAHHKLAEEVTRFSREMRSLRALVERYIRAQTDGSSRN